MGFETTVPGLPSLTSRLLPTSCAGQSADGVAEWLQEAVSGNGHSDGPSALRLHLVDARLHRDTERMPGKNPRAKAAKGRSKSQAQRDLQGLAA